MTEFKAVLDLLKTETGFESVSLKLSDFFAQLKFIHTQHHHLLLLFLLRYSFYPFMVSVRLSQTELLI